MATLEFFRVSCTCLSRHRTGSISRIIQTAPPGDYFKGCCAISVARTSLRFSANQVGGSRGCSGLMYPAMNSSAIMGGCLRIQPRHRCFGLNLPVAVPEGFDSFSTISASLHFARWFNRHGLLFLRQQFSPEVKRGYPATRGCGENVASNVGRFFVLAPADGDRDKAQ